VLTTGGDDARRIARELFRDIQNDRPDVDKFVHLTDVPEPIELVHELRMHGHTAHPNHVFFAHCDCCGPHPSNPCGGEQASPVYAAPVYAAPVYAAPVYAAPVYAAPVYAAPVYAAPVYAAPVYAAPVYAAPVYAAPQHSTARPAQAGAATQQLEALDKTPRRTGGPTVIVLDTGMAESAFAPAALSSPAPMRAASPTDVDAPDENDDHLLDPAAGHGTFIAGLIGQVSPGCEIVVHRVLSTFGDGDEASIVHSLRNLGISDPAHTIVNLSFGGYVLEHPYALARAIRTLQSAGVVVVASAGNDGTCRPTFPAALPGVVGVGAVGPNGPAPFTNYGPWVRACAPGVDLVSTFFDHFNGRDPRGTDGADPDKFGGWAVWSGTSFSAPVVVGALARTMMDAGCTGREAVARVIDAPALMRINGLGTVVNVI
jgi:hypothetical protein